MLLTPASSLGRSRRLAIEVGCTVALGLLPQLIIWSLALPFRPPYLAVWHHRGITLEVDRMQVCFLRICPKHESSQSGVQAPGQETPSACSWVVQRLDSALQSASVLYLGPTRLMLAARA